MKKDHCIENTRIVHILFFMKTFHPRVATISLESRFIICTEKCLSSARISCFTIDYTSTQGLWLVMEARKPIARTQQKFSYTLNA